MAILLISAAGAAIGSAAGIGIAALGISGASLGWTLGGLIGQMIIGGPTAEGPRLEDLRTTGTEYGQVIPWITGSARLAGQVIWASDKRETANTTEQGKGGGAEYTTYSYDVDLLILLSDNQIPGISRIWKNSELVYTPTSTKSDVWSRMTVYTGDPAQLPDPVYEAAVGSDNAVAYRGRSCVFIEGLQLGYSGTIPNLTFEISSTPESEDLVNVCSALMARAGYAASDYSFSEMLPLAKTVRGLAVSQVSPTRSVLEQIQTAYLFDISCSDKIYFRPRSTMPIAEIPWTTLGLTEGSADEEEPFQLRTSNELEVPAQIAVSYNNVNADYQTATEYSDRLLSTQKSTNLISLPLGLTPTEAKQIVNAIVTDQIGSLTGTTIKLPAKYAYIEPNDVVTVRSQDGSKAFRLKIVSKKDALGNLEFDCILNENSIVEYAAITDDEDQSIYTVIDVAPTVWEILDIPILRDIDDSYGYYVAGKGADVPNTYWPGAVLVRSPDNVTFNQVGLILKKAVFGTCQTVLADFTGGNIFDETNELTVDVGKGQLSSSTREALFADKSVNVMLVGSEIIRFKNAVLISPGVYKLSGLLRGLRGTDWAIGTHGSEERCVLLSAAGMLRVSDTLAQVGTPTYIKAVTQGLLLSTATAEEFTSTSVGLKPFSPVYLRIVKNQTTGSFNVSWIRRTRKEVVYFGNTGGNYPLGEASELYRLKFYVGGTLVRTQETATTNFEYTTSMLTADGLVSGQSFTLQVVQLSDRVGEGYPVVGQGTV